MRLLAIIFCLVIECSSHAEDVIKIGKWDANTNHNPKTNEIIANKLYKVSVVNDSEIVYYFKDGKKPDGILKIWNANAEIVKDSEKSYFQLKVKSGDYFVQFSSKIVDKVQLGIDYKL